MPGASPLSVCACVGPVPRALLPARVRTTQTQHVATCRDSRNPEDTEQGSWKPLLDVSLSPPSMPSIEDGGCYPSDMEEVKEELVHLQVRIPEPLHRRLKVLAAQKGKSVSDILRDFIEWYVTK